MHSREEKEQGEIHSRHVVTGEEIIRAEEKKNGGEKSREKSPLSPCDPESEESRERTDQKGRHRIEKGNIDPKEPEAKSRHQKMHRRMGDEEVAIGHETVEPQLRSVEVHALIRGGDAKSLCFEESVENEDGADGADLDDARDARSE